MINIRQTIRRTGRRQGLFIAVAFAVIGIGLTYATMAAEVTTVNTTSDTSFATLPIGAGGWVTGIATSNDGTTRLVRTDTYGGYYWDTAKDRWIQNVSASSMPAEDVKDTSNMGIYGIAVAPTDATKAYMAYGTSVYKSVNSGKTWTKSLLNKPGNSNDDFRFWGERLVVDPNNANVVYYGSQLNGMWVSLDAGNSWSGVATSMLPAGNVYNPTTRPGCITGTATATVNGTPQSSAGINSIAFDTSQGMINGRTKVVYATSHGKGIYRSADGGFNWTKISSDSQQTTTKRLAVMSNGDLFATSTVSPTDVCGSTQVWRYRAGQWTDRTPNNQGWNSIAVDPKTPGRIVIIAQGGRTALSTNYGDNWTIMGDQWSPSGRTTSSTGDIPWLANALGTHEWMSLGGIQFDPVVPNRLWITEGVGVWYHDVRSPSTYTATSPLDWHSHARGIEQLVATDVIHAPAGKPVVSSWDRPLFRSESPNSFPLKYGPTFEFGSGWSLDWSLTDPNFVVASVASHQWPGTPVRSGYSTDGGQNWIPFGSIPLGSTNSYDTWGFGQIAVSTPDNMVWVPSHGKRPYFTKDRGTTWQPVTLPGVSDYSLANDRAYYVKRKIVTADKVTAGVFYMFVRNHGLFRTTDGGTSWTRMNSTNIADADVAWGVLMKSVPTKAGHLFFTPGHLDGITTQPFMRSSDNGTSWSTIPNVTSVFTYGFGKAAPGASYPAIYIAGAVNGTFGVYRSTDNAVSWTLLSSRPLGSLDGIVTMDGDKDVYGRVYLGYSGSGWAYGQLSSTTTEPTPTPAPTPPPPSTSLPDVVITSLTMTPASPKTGDRVVFTATVKNQGAAATPAGVVVGVGFFVNGGYTHWATNSPLAAGQTVTITAAYDATGAPINYWTASTGTHTVKAVVDDVNRFAESNEANNEYSTTVSVATATTATPGDANKDGRVNAIDLSIVLSRDGQAYAAADFNGDGTVGAADMAILLGKWTW